MRRKYAVYIDGKPLTIVENPDPRAGSQHELILRIDDPGEIPPAVDRLKESKDIGALMLFGEDVEKLWAAFRRGYHFVQAAGGCVTDERSRLLAIQRLGLWDLPKGKVDEGESIEAAAVREVMEECGLRKVELREKLCETWHTYERKGRQHLKRTDWYLMRASSHERLVAQWAEDITAVQWMDPAALSEMKRSTYPSLLGVISAWEGAVPGRA